MQSRDEIQRTARREGVPATTIEKDLLLDVMLDTIARAPYAAGTFYFKGGTAIRKLFVPGYRYSEDLDFTFEGSWNMAALRRWLSDAAATMQQTTGQSRQSLTVRETRKVAGEEALDAHLIVSSRLSSTLTQRIKFDITRFEHVLDPVEAHLDSGLLLPAYSLEEIVAEKTRSLFQRVRPRDLYDLATLAARVDATTVHKLASQKMLFKNVTPTWEHLLERKPDFSTAWLVSLKKLMRNVPPFEQHWQIATDYMVTLGLLPPQDTG
jgi:predicted nucleotidyltransferase component of viral defense system